MSKILVGEKEMLINEFTVLESLFYQSLNDLQNDKCSENEFKYTSSLIKNRQEKIIKRVRQLQIEEENSDNS